jgi:hypothetical protein
MLSIFPCNIAIVVYRLLSLLFLFYLYCFEPTVCFCFSSSRSLSLKLDVFSVNFTKQNSTRVEFTMNDDAWMKEKKVVQL